MEPDLKTPVRHTKQDVAAILLCLNMALEHCGPETKKGIAALAQQALDRIAACAAE